jgi:hypothetical protein
MKSLVKNAAFADRYTQHLNRLLDNECCGNIDGVEFDLRHENLDQDQWSMSEVLGDILYLPNEIDNGTISNRNAVWFPWFGQFNATILRAEVTKMSVEKIEKLVREIEGANRGQIHDPAERLIALQTPKYFVGEGDKITVRGVTGSVVGGDHLHEHDRLVKVVSVAITKAGGSSITIEPPYNVTGNHTLVNPIQEAKDPFGSILFRIVHAQNLKRPTQLRKYKAGESDISTASEIAYRLYKIIEPAWDESEPKQEYSSEQMQDAEYDLHLVSEAALLGYLWAKIEFEANLMPLADLAKRRTHANRMGGVASGIRRREQAETGWKRHAKELAVNIREEEPSASQDKVAEGIIECWRPSWPHRRPGFPTLKKLVGEMEKIGELPRARKV